MFKRLGFGKREKAAPLRHPGPDADGVSRAIPKDIWDGPHGEMLRELGLTPDDPTNLMPTPQSVQARFDRQREQQTRFLAELNASLPDGCEVIPWAMLPWSLWQQTHADFLLVTMDFYPVDPWNTMLLPADARTAATLGLPEHLRGTPPGLEDGANRLIGELRAELATLHEETGAILARGGGATSAALAAYDTARTDAKSKIVALAHYLGSVVYGEETFDRHRNLFGPALGWTRRSA